MKPLGEALQQFGFTVCWWYPTIHCYSRLWGRCFWYSTPGGCWALDGGEQAQIKPKVAIHTSRFSFGASVIPNRNYLCSSRFLIRDCFWTCGYYLNSIWRLYVVTFGQLWLVHKLCPYLVEEDLTDSKLQSHYHCISICNVLYMRLSGYYNQCRMWYPVSSTLSQRLHLYWGPLNHYGEIWRRRLLKSRLHSSGGSEVFFSKLHDMN